jgi:hypothetical protein
MGYEAGARRLKKIGSLLREGPLVSPYELVQSEKARFVAGGVDRLAEQPKERAVFSNEIAVA